MMHGLNVIHERALGTNLFLEVVSKIRKVDMEIRRVPGTTLKNQHGEVIYTPPVGEATIRDLLKNLEKFIHAEDELDPLIKLAVMHYQFEAIHPFTDGNGRTGRIGNILYLVGRKLLTWPVLYLSDYILRNKAEYYALLRAVTEKSAWEPWVLFMLKAIQVTSIQTSLRVVRILLLMEETKELVSKRASGIYSWDLIQVVFQNPYCKIRFVEDAGLAKRQTASAYLQKLEELGVLKARKIGREMYYINEALIKTLSASEG